MTMFVEGYEIELQHTIRVVRVGPLTEPKTEIEPEPMAVLETNGKRKRLPGPTKTDLEELVDTYIVTVKPGSPQYEFCKAMVSSIHAYDEFKLAGPVAMAESRSGGRKITTTHVVGGLVEMYPDAIELRRGREHTVIVKDREALSDLSADRLYVIASARATWKARQRKEARHNGQHS